MFLVRGGAAVCRMIREGSGLCSAFQIQCTYRPLGMVSKEIPVGCGGARL